MGDMFPRCSAVLSPPALCGAARCACHTLGLLYRALRAALPDSGGEQAAGSSCCPCSRLPHLKYNCCPQTPGLETSRSVPAAVSSGCHARLSRPMEHPRSSQHPALLAGATWKGSASSGCLQPTSSLPAAHLPRPSALPSPAACEDASEFTVAGSRSLGAPAG